MYSDLFTPIPKLLSINDALTQQDYIASSVMQGSLRFDIYCIHFYVCEEIEQGKRFNEKITLTNLRSDEFLINFGYAVMSYITSILYANTSFTLLHRDLLLSRYGVLRSTAAVVTEDGDRYTDSS